MIGVLHMSNCVSAFFSKVTTVFLCVTSALVLSSCVETLDFPSIDLSGKSSKGWETGEVIGSSDVRDKKVVGRVVHKNIKSESLLHEEGVWNLVEQSKSYDPAQAHLEARQKVDTSRRRNDTTLAAHFEPDAKSGKDGKLRVLRVDAGKSSFDIYKDIEIAESSFVKPSNTVAGAEHLQKITSVFGKQKPLLKHDVVPSRKPAQGRGGRDIEDVVRSSLSEAFEAVGVGVVRPPALPARKKPRKVVQQVGIAAQSPVEVERVAGVDGAPIPKSKPAVSSSVKSKVIQNGDLPSGVSIVNDLRAAVHNGKFRLVIETKNATRYKVVVDHIRRVLRVKLDSARLKMSPQGSLSKANALFGTYIAREKSDGSVLLEVRMKKESQILDTMILRPNLSSNHRIVIDMKK